MAVAVVVDAVGGAVAVVVVAVGGVVAVVLESFTDYKAFFAG